MANNTDIELEIDEFNFDDDEINNLQYEDDSERVNIQFNNSSGDYNNFIAPCNSENNVNTEETITDTPKLSLNELRKKRLAFYSKKK